MRIIAAKELRDVRIIDLEMIEIHRGSISQPYHAEDFHKAGIDSVFVQDNEVLLKQAGFLRGLHYQLQPKAQSRLIRVQAGAIYCVAIDIRRSSPTFGHWTGVVLSELNMRQVYIPAGFAHGYCTLLENTQMMIRVTEYDSPEHSRGIRWDDPFIGIRWPVSRPILTSRDIHFPVLGEAEIDSEFEIVDN